MELARVQEISLPMTGRVVVISDIHGRLDYLEGLLAQVQMTKDDTLILLGDYTERGPQGLETLRFIMDLMKKHRVYAVLGNCDNVNLGFVDGGKHPRPEFFPRWFRTHGENALIVQMAHLIGLSVDEPEEYPRVAEALKVAYREELDFLRSLPHVLRSEGHLFVHAGLPQEYDLESLEAYPLMKRDAFAESAGIFLRKLIVGHWPVSLYLKRVRYMDPMFSSCRTVASIDGGCGVHPDGQLNALVLSAEPKGRFPVYGAGMEIYRYDKFPICYAMDLQTEPPVQTSVNLCWANRNLELVKRGEEFSQCVYHPPVMQTGGVAPPPFDFELDVLTKTLVGLDESETDRNGRPVTEVYSEGYTNWVLGVLPGDELRIVHRTSRGLIVKKGGLMGWYFGRVRPK